MRADRDIERLLDALLADGAMPVSDRAFDEAVGRIYRQPQRAAWRFLTWRFPTVSTSLKLALAGGALLAVLLGSAFMSSGGFGLGPMPMPTSTITPTPSLTATPLPTLGTVRMQVQGDLAPWTATVPPGWTSEGGSWYLTPSQGPEGPTGIAIAASGAVNVPSDPCDPAGRYSDAEAPAEVLAELEARDDLVVSDPIDTTLGGYAGLRVDVEFPADLSYCSDDNAILFAEPDGNGIHVLGPSNRFRVWILDVDGRPVVFWITSFPGTPADDLVEAQQIVDSIVIGF